MATVETVRVAVIGIGSAGLCQLKQLKDAFAREEVRSKKRLELVGYEGRSDVGGLWNYDPEPPEFVTRHLGNGTSDKSLVYPPAGHFSTTAVYEGLVATLPHELMSFRGYKFPPDTPTFPSHEQVTDYLHAYAQHYDLYKYVRFNTLVERLRLSEDVNARRWRLTARGSNGVEETDFDFVVVSNGHYSDPWIPPSMRGLRDWPGRVLHSRQYRRAKDFAGQTVLVVGSFSSGSDITRLLGTMNHQYYTRDGRPRNVALPLDQGFTTIYQSTTGLPNSSFTADPKEPWKPYIKVIPLIDHFEGPTTQHPKGQIVLIDGQTLDSVDTVIFATGYNNSLPFCKVNDLPWRSQPLLDEVITAEERVGGDEWEVSGLRGLRMRGMDELLLFLQNDRSIAFLGLQYQIVPFPFAEAQARLAALLWAGKLPSFPDHLNPPPNVHNATLTPASSTTDLTVTDHAPIRRSVRQRGEYVFPNPYEWDYTEYIFGLMEEAEVDAAEPSAEHWRKVEDWRREQRADTTMRKRVLGY